MAVPTNHDKLKQQESRVKTVTEAARRAGVLLLMKNIRNLRDRLNGARANLASAPSPITILTATASLAEAKRDLQQAEDDLVGRWNASIANRNHTAL